MLNSHAHPPLKAVTLTHVMYQRGDQFGHFLAWISLVPVFISLGGFVSHFIFRRELQGMFFALGLLISQFINEIIKTSVQQARPETCALLEIQKPIVGCGTSCVAFGGLYYVFEGVFGVSHGGSGLRWSCTWGGAWWRLVLGGEFFSPVLLSDH
ncbi:unnamed protein product [Fraxinus pennsylvanica]|uniref:Dolichyldiphosphatase n=1 Tax=Fraxinus pennsylvanica TaxID=56036 RepID=A0AAD2E9X8_9LAMI|nr:unnamed protein product [Fraxinus pennsylvanica]